MTSERSAEPVTRATLRARHIGDPAAAPLDPEAPPARPRPLVAVGAVLAGLVLAGLSRLDGSLPLIVGYLVLGLVVVVGWPRLLGSATPVGSSLVLLTALVGIATALAVREPVDLALVTVGVGAGVVAMCLQPLVQAPARETLAAHLAASALGIAVLTCGAVLLTAPATGGYPVAVAGVAVAVAAVADLATERPGRQAWMLPVAVLLGGLGGLATSLALDGGLGAWAALLGMLVAGVALCLRRMLAQLPAIDSPAAPAAGVASVLVVGPVVHLLARALLG